MKYLRITMPDNSKWDVPVDLIIADRSQHYAEKEPNKSQAYFIEETRELFEDDDFEIEDWAANNMNWDQIKHKATRIKDGDIDWQEGWVNGEKEIVEK